MLLSAPAFSAALPEPSLILESQLNYFYFDYRETLPAPFKSNELGWMPGLGLRVRTNDSAHAGFGDLSLDLAQAATVYDGTRQNGDPVLDESQHIFVNVEGRWGQWLTPADWQVFGTQAFVGAGYRHWDRTVAGDYDEIYSWKYLTLGIQPKLAIGEALTMGLEISYKQMLDGHMRLYLNESTPLEFDLGERAGYKISAPIVFQPDAKLSFKLLPWYEYSGIGRSNTLSGLYTLDDVLYSYEMYEPESNTVQYGVSMAARLVF